MNALRETDGRPLRRIAAVHDLSCFGRCALTVILPTLSAMDNQVVPLPTALLSSHTGGFTDLHFRDLTQDMKKIVEHFDRLFLSFNAIYTGFLGDAEQIRVVRRFAEHFGNEKTLVLVDPVMGDDGELYSTYTPALCEGMKELCFLADVITPNLTEACILTDTPYTDTQDMSAEKAEAFSRKLCEKLRRFGNKKIVITGIPHSTNQLASFGLDTESSASFFDSHPSVPCSYPGTGDLFASVLLGSLLRGDPFRDAVSFSSSFTARVMEYSSRFPTPHRDGVAFEHFLGELTPPSAN